MENNAHYFFSQENEVWSVKSIDNGIDHGRECLRVLFWCLQIFTGVQIVY